MIFGGSTAKEYSGALMQDGSLYMWGNNLYGQIGNGERTSDRNLWPNSPVKIFDGDTGEFGLPKGFQYFDIGDSVYGSNTYTRTENMSYYQDQVDLDGDGETVNLHGKIVNIDLFNGYSPLATMEDGTNYYWGSETYDSTSGYESFPTIGSNTQLEISKTAVNVYDIDENSVQLAINFAPIRTDVINGISIDLLNMDDSTTTGDIPINFIGYDAELGSWLYELNGLDSNTSYQITGI